MYSNEWREQMVKQIRKIIAVTALLGIIANMLSCTKPGLSTATNTPHATKIPPPTQTPLAPIDFSSPDTGGTITFAIFSFLKDAYQPVVEEFHRQNPSITVEMVNLPQVTDPRAVASTADTSLLLFIPSTGVYFLDVSPFEAGDPTFDAGRFWHGSTEGCSSADGRRYGLPISIMPTGIYYREKAFDAAGIPYPQPGWTWEDFQKDMSALTKDENGQTVYGFADDSFVDTPDETVLSSSISYLLEQSGGEIDPAKLASELGWYEGLVKSKALLSENIYPIQSPLHDPSSVIDWSVASNATWKIVQTMFKKTPPAMWKGGLYQKYWGTATYEAQPDGSIISGGPDIILRTKQLIGWAPFPVSADGKNVNTTPVSVTCGVISSGTQSPRAAWTWLNFLASHPVPTEGLVEIAAQPAAADAIGSWDNIPEKMRASVKYALEHGWYSNPYPQEVLAVNLALLQSVSQGTDLQTALEQAKSQFTPVPSPTQDLTPVVVATP
jgi:ABC-type glycerol-3-phosphate transport system substrate-binding protein